VTDKVKFEEELPEVTSPALTGSDANHVTGSDVTGSHLTGRYPEPEVIACASATGICSTVVHVPWLPEVTEGHVTPKEVPLGVPKRVPLCVRTYNWKLRNIRPSGAF
jgi:hypothetical protein